MPLPGPRCVWWSTTSMFFSSLSVRTWEGNPNFLTAWLLNRWLAYYGYLCLISRQRISLWYPHWVMSLHTSYDARRLYIFPVYQMGQPSSKKLWCGTRTLQFLNRPLIVFSPHLGIEMWFLLTKNQNVQTLKEFVLHSVLLFYYTQTWCWYPLYGNLAQADTGVVPHLSGRPRFILILH